MITKDVIGYEGKYVVTSDGVVISVKSGKPLKQHKQNKGYLYVSLCSGGGTPKKTTVHRIVASAFISGSGVVNHKDGNKENNKASNLEFVTYSENNKHAYDSGLRQAPKNTVHGSGNLNYKGAIQGTNIDTGEVIVFHGAKEMNDSGFDSRNVYACVNGRIKRYKRHTFKRI